MKEVWYNEFIRFTKLTKQSQMALLKHIARRYPWLYLVSPMSRAERKFYSPKLKRPNSNKDYK